MAILCDVYLLGMLAVSLRLLYVMLFNLDRYDYRYNRVDIAVVFILSNVLWPLFLRKPRLLFSPEDLFKPEFFDMAAITRNKDKLFENVPLCTNTILYRQGIGRCSTTYGEFVFDADDVEEVLNNKLVKNKHLYSNDEGAIAFWLNRRDKSNNTVCEAPRLWSRFSLLADELLRAGMGSVRCVECEMSIDIKTLVKNDTSGNPGWNFNKLECPNKHLLLEVETMHILMRKDSE
ncbi:hypothetical protein [Dasania marina]|uniref:hypothetical protein n=1 Tax=Dasania marina TaxID=471499 RepID=UPI00036BA702|nr:hypothetical protein [Dasania marina]